MKAKTPPARTGTRDYLRSTARLAFNPKKTYLSCDPATNEIAIRFGHPRLEHPWFRQPWLVRDVSSRAR